MTAKCFIERQVRVILSFLFDPTTSIKDMWFKKDLIYFYTQSQKSYFPKLNTNKGLAWTQRTNSFLSLGFDGFSTGKQEEISAWLTPSIRTPTDVGRGILWSDFKSDVFKAGSFALPFSRSWFRCGMGQVKIYSLASLELRFHPIPILRIGFISTSTSMLTVLSFVSEPFLRLGL